MPDGNTKENNFASTIEKRVDCEYFEPKEHPNQCGSCQTDGHYLCGGCSHIAPFLDMELSDNRMRYYPKQEKEAIQNENKKDECLHLVTYVDDDNFWRCQTCGEIVDNEL